ncbi:hypothetical protein HNR06_000096 [Nocardiopsis arvandica]|uniref:Uncharacterized protein n=1 Tax=Nocardiopsis sinuspersici TaxID=501010 RepID=A0A7Z0BIK5_9ACTN|nr:hypothetical protein [Nocardiopsis sinuspersici]NYH50507.1 hypothetical protein [Nocardiopsis sinuspersici]
MSVVVLFGVGALIGLVALTVVVIVTLLMERPESAAEETPSEPSDTAEPARAPARDGSVV